MINRWDIEGRMRRRLSSAVLLLLLVCYAGPVLAAPSVFIEDLTWMEVKERMQAGATTAIVPTGGSAQNGPQLAIGAHNAIVHYTAGEIARKLGNALVAPVIAYVPEGRITPPEGHMQFAGTLSVSEETFAALLEETARSLKQHGFKLICFIGDDSGSQAVQWQVAQRLNDSWRAEGVRVLQVSDYYARNGQVEWGDSMGLKVADPKAHGGHIVTSEVLAIDPQGVRDTMRGAHSEKDYRATGATGDSTQASLAYGRRYLSLKVEAALSQIQNAGANVR